MSDIKIYLSTLITYIIYISVFGYSFPQEDEKKIEEEKEKKKRKRHGI